MISSATTKNIFRSGISRAAFVICFAFIAACSREPVQPRHIADVAAPDGIKAAFYLYIPGSILDEWMTLEVETDKTRATMLYATYCERIGGKISKDQIDVVVFKGRWSVTAPHTYEAFEAVAPAQGIDVVVRSIDRSPEDQELEELKADGYTIVKCEANKNRDSESTG